MKINELKNSTNKTSRKRLGRGRSSGKGKTSGRGTKGQKSRTGFNIPNRFEGGQVSLIQRMPKKRGFKPRANKPKAIRIDNILAKVKDPSKINIKLLTNLKLVKNSHEKIKIVGANKKIFLGEIKIKGIKFSQSLIKK